MRGLGIANLDWRAGRQRRASLGPRGGTYADLESAQLIVALGRPPSQTAPVLDLRVRKAVQLGARYVTVGPHAAKAFVPALNLPRLDALAPYLEGVRRVAFVWDGIDVRVGAEADALMESLASRGVAVAAFVTGEQNNARGAEAFGLLPRDGGLDSAGMFATALRGELRTLALFGVNPVLHHPLGGDAVRAALERVPFVVASELFPTQTVSLAHLVLPARGPFEKSGHAYGLAGDVLAVHAAHTPPDGTLSDGEMLVALAAALGLDVPAPDELAALASAPPPASAAPRSYSGLGYEPRAAGTQDSPELRLALASNVFAGGGTVWFDERLAELRPVPSATLAPGTAAEAGLRAGDAIDLAAGPRLLPGLVVRLDDEVPAGVVSVVDGLPDAPANAFGDGDVVRVASVRPAEAERAGGGVR